MDSTLTFVSDSFLAGTTVLNRRSREDRKQGGQFLTPPVVARYMAEKLGSIPDQSRILEPAIGSGTLACAVIERLIAEGQPKEIWLDGFEIDPEMLSSARSALQQSVMMAQEVGIRIHVRLFEEDFIAYALSCLNPQPSLMAQTDHLSALPYDFIISNPPYLKLSRETPDNASDLSRYLRHHANLYTAFMSASAGLLSPQGRACFLVPRGFCSGKYFTPFRKDFLRQAVPEEIHLFESRNETFADDEVLQENIIISFRHRQAHEVQSILPVPLIISTSRNGADLSEQSTRSLQIKGDVFVGAGRESFYRLPVCDFDVLLLRAIDQWTGSFEQYGYRISTGPVVPFRSKDLLADSDGRQRAPLLWMQHVRPQSITWPLEKFRKPQTIAINSHPQEYLVPSANYVILRRFSSKEEARRLIAAPLFGKEFSDEWLGIENHLNTIAAARQSELTPEIAAGLAALLNNPLLDRYIRIINGNTQVNAAELRNLPLPPLSVIQQIGQAVQAEAFSDMNACEELVYNRLLEAGCIPPLLPLIRETRIRMGKIQEAQALLQELGLPSAQQNEMSALTLLVLVGLTEESGWQQAAVHSLRIHDILLGIKDHYGREYAENTRETIRRQVIHQFEQAGIVTQNPDEPDLPTNSPRTRYALSAAALEAMVSYGTSDWPDAVRHFVDQQGALLETYQKRREQHKIPLVLPDGETVHLSPGEHNALQVAVIQEFGPRFAPGAQILYLGDTANKALIMEKKALSTLGLDLPEHDKLPDIILYDPTRSRLFLIEAVTSHGPVSPKRFVELAAIFGVAKLEIIYVSAFPDFAMFKKFLTDIAWETEVWVADIPDHLIHFNGDRFLGS
jgi:adenine-specific DNA-methyltransferase